MLTRRDPFVEMFSDLARFTDLVQRINHSGIAPRTQLATVPLVNVWEDENAIYAEADLPGIALDKLDIHVTEGNQLTLQGEFTAPEATSTWHRQERPLGQFARVLTLPALVDADKVEAKLELGVLKLTLPKSEAAKPRRISVQSA